MVFKNSLSASSVFGIGLFGWKISSVSQYGSLIHKQYIGFLLWWWWGISSPPCYKREPIVNRLFCLPLAMLILPTRWGYMRHPMHRTSPTHHCAAAVGLVCFLVFWCDASLCHVVGELLCSLSHRSSPGGEFLPHPVTEREGALISIIAVRSQNRRGRVFRLCNRDGYRIDRIDHSYRVCNSWRETPILCGRLGSLPILSERQGRTR